LGLLELFVTLEAFGEADDLLEIVIVRGGLGTTLKPEDRDLTSSQKTMQCLKEMTGGARSPGPFKFTHTL